MHKWLALVISVLVSSVAATEPFSDSLTVSKDGKYSVRIKAWDDKKERILFIKTPSGEAGLTMTELGFDAGLESYPNLTTAGWDWYQNSITYIHPDSNIYAIRLKSSRTIFIDLVSRKVIKKPRDEISKEIDGVFAEKAIEMLGSTDARARETGAIFVGQLRVKKAIPRLKEMLTDRSWYTVTYGDEEPMVILYVRKAAKKALVSLGQKVDGVVTEVPSKGHVIEKDYRYTLRLDGDKGKPNGKEKKTSVQGNKVEW